MLCLSQENELTAKHLFQALYFYSAWEPFHRKTLIMLEKIEEKYPIIDFFSIDVDVFKGLIKRFNIMTVPTVIILNNFKEAARLENTLGTVDFIATFADICSKGNS
jgi:thiol-disulfide isomerase/thioredoxin